MNFGICNPTFIPIVSYLFLINKIEESGFVISISEGLDSFFSQVS